MPESFEHRKDKNQLDEKDLEKLNKKKDIPDRTSLENLNNKDEEQERKKNINNIINESWIIKDYACAIKTSPESKQELDTETNNFKKELSKLEEEFWTWELSPEQTKEKENKKQKLVETYLSNIKSIVWTKEWSQAEQTKQYSEQLKTQWEHYTKLLEDFHEILRKWSEECERNRIKKWLEQWSEARKKWDAEAEKDRKDAKEVIEVLSEWSRKQ